MPSLLLPMGTVLICTLIECGVAALAYMKSFLILLVQRSPLLRVLADGRLLAAPRFANILKFTTVELRDSGDGHACRDGGNLA